MVDCTIWSGIHQVFSLDCWSIAILFHLNRIPADHQHFLQKKINIAHFVEEFLLQKLILEKKKIGKSHLVPKQWRNMVRQCYVCKMGKRYCVRKKITCLEQRSSSYWFRGKKIISDILLNFPRVCNSCMEIGWQISRCRFFFHAERALCRLKNKSTPGGRQKNPLRTAKKMKISVFFLKLSLFFFWAFQVEINFNFNCEVT